MSSNKTFSQNRKTLLANTFPAIFYELTLTKIILNGTPTSTVNLIHLKPKIELTKYKKEF